MAARIEIGERHGDLVILTALPEKINLCKVFEAQCSCGTIMKVTSTTFRRKISCVGCSNTRGAATRTTHGGSGRGRQEALYGAWKAMITRCTNPNARAYRWYGAKGIKVCPDWLDYATYRRWALANGYAPGMTLDRLDSKEDYRPDNCGFLTQAENSKRMRAAYHFVTKPDPFAEHFPIEALFGTA